MSRHVISHDHQQCLCMQMHYVHHSDARMHPGRFDPAWIHANYRMGHHNKQQFLMDRMAQTGFGRSTRHPLPFPYATKQLTMSCHSMCSAALHGGSGCPLRSLLHSKPNEAVDEPCHTFSAPAESIKIKYSAVESPASMPNVP